MATIVEVYKPKTKETKEGKPQKNTFYWYNVFYKRMEKLEGSELRIGYHEEQYVIKDGKKHGLNNRVELARRMWNEQHADN